VAFLDEDAAAAGQGDRDDEKQHVGELPEQPAANTDAAGEESPPIVIIPGEDRVTIASEDTEALDQLESLLRSMLSRRESARGRDFTVYALQNASAVTVADTVNEFFKRNSPVTSANVLVVPDSRLNALIVYAGRTDREKIEDLIQTLDSENIPDSLAAYQTRIVPVKHADAAKMSRTIQGIYKAQMTAGGARQNVAIPEGVPTSIASVLRQINAAASSPLLTVEVDSATNSLVLMAPANLLDEVSNLVTELDEAAAQSDARELRIIPLRKVRSTRVMELLQKITD
jgi:type II secretory pathway component GspD/PulD (secretin)